MGWNDLIGMRLDQYDILDELGRGGSSRVYHAFDTELHRDVAIKVIPNDADDRALFIGRFHHEVIAVQQLNHPNVVAVYGAGENDEFVYLVMQCVTGGTLRKKLNDPMSVPDAVANIVQIAYALQHAHEKGIIHRDVKPSNMLLEYPGSKHMLLTDFGIAKIQGARGLTKSGTTIGTPEYMSPEQAEGRDIDERSDIYALGCVLYETLAGRPPFLGSTPVSVLFQHVHSRPAYIRGFNPGVPAELVQILEIALAKRPDERYGSADSFARALLPFAGQLPDVTPQLSGGGPIVIARSRGLTPSRPLPKQQRIKETDISERDTLQNSMPVAPRPGIYEEATAPLPALSARRTAPPSRTNKNAPPSRTRKTLPPYVQIRRTAPLSQWGVPLGPPEAAPQEPEWVNGVAQPVTPKEPMKFGDRTREPISLPLGSPRSRGAVAASSRANSTGQADGLGQRGPNSRPGSPNQRKPGDSRIPATQAKKQKPRRRFAGIIAAIVVLALFGATALNASRLGINLGFNARTSATQTVAPTATLQPTATSAPTGTAGPQPTATLTQQQILNKQANASFRGVILSTFVDSSCSSGNNRTTFGSGQGIYVNLCTSGRAVSAPMTIVIRHNGQVAYTMAYGIYISPSSSYYYYTTHAFSPGTYDLLVTLNINGSTAVARDITVYIK
jgi:serine/threonine protein kinase